MATRAAIAKPKRKPVKRAVRRVHRPTMGMAVGRVLNAERSALLAGDTELSAAIKLASGMPLGTKQELQAAVQSGMYGNVFAGGSAPAMAARFDSAMTTADNQAHWSMADGLAADAAANPMIRYVLRNRARYEAANNCYARGLIDAYATDLIGTGPRLQMETGDDDADAWIEAEFSRWARAAKLAEKLRTMSKAKMGDGEAFALQISNPGMPTPVKLDLRTIEADQVRFVDISLLTVPSVDGIRFDDYGNPVSYHVLRVHPGFWSYATGYVGFPWEYDVWPSKFVMHWFRKDRAGQHRGLPDIMPALPLFAQLRRVTLAVLQAYETVANHAFWMKTPLSAEQMADTDTEIVAPNPFDMFPLHRNTITTLPDGYDIGQTEAQHPKSEHDAFTTCILREIGRCIKAPYRKISGDSAQANFSADNHNELDWWRGIEETHKDLEYDVLDRTLAAWLLEARGVRVDGSGDFGAPYIPANVRRVLGNITGAASDLPTHTWNWQGMAWPNPQQIAAADQINLQMGTDTYARIYGRGGRDHRKAFAANAKALNLTPQEYVEKVIVPNLIQRPAVAAQAEQPDPAATVEPANAE